MIVDRCVDVQVGRSGSGVLAVFADRGQLFDVHVYEITRFVMHIPCCVWSGEVVLFVESSHAVAVEDLLNGRTSESDLVGDSGRAATLTQSQVQHLGLFGFVGAVRAVMRCAGTIIETGIAFG